MHDINIYFVGGTINKITGVSEEIVNKLADWLDNKADTKTFTINIPSKNTTKLIRKELILFIDVI